MKKVHQKESKWSAITKVDFKLFGIINYIIVSIHKIILTDCTYSQVQYLSDRYMILD
jgi:hypothetical protein